MNARTIPLLTLLAAAGTAHAQCSFQQIYHGDPQTTAFNGAAVAIDGTYILTGAPGETVSGHASAGEVYAFAPFGALYGQVAHIISPSPAASESFGCSVGLSAGAQWAVVGAKGAAQGAGQAYIYRRDLNTNLWNYVSTLGPGGNGGAALGKSVSINTQGSIAVVGVPGATISDIFGTVINAGQALVYARNANNTWSYQFDLRQYDPNIRRVGDYYGSAVACDGGTIVAGCPFGDTASLSDCGYVHFWSQNANFQWTASGEVYAPDQETGAYFGYAVSINGGIAVVGAPGAHNGAISGAGKAYVYELVSGNWVYKATLTAPDASTGSNFGTKVSVHGTHIVVGDYSLVQKCYLFRRTAAGQWVQDAAYSSPPGGAAGDNFACDVGVSNNAIVMGASGFDTPNFSSNGCGYVYDLPTAGSDSCEGATPMAQGTVTGCTDHCTIDGSSTCGGLNNGPDVWYSYTAPSSGQVTIDTQGSTLDTILSIHSGCPGTAANTIACNDDFAAPQRWSKVTFNVTQGQTYLVRIAGYANSTGDYTLTIGPVSATCYANCDGSTTPPILNVNDFTCFLNKYAANDPSANCDNSTAQPVLNVNDFICFQTKYAQGCP